MGGPLQTWGVAVADTNILGQTPYLLGLGFNICRPWRLDQMISVFHSSVSQLLVLWVL